MSEFNSGDHYIYYCGQESLRRNGVAIIVNKRVQNAVLGCGLKMTVSVHFQGKPFSITVIQVYALTSSAEEAEVEWFYEDLRDLLELKPKIDVFLELSCFFNDPGDVGNFKVVKQEMTRVNIDILGIRELKWTGMGKFNSDDQYLPLWARIP